VGMTTATKAAFLGQMTAVFTPALAMLAGQPVPPPYWAACLAALVGSCCIAVDGMQPDAALPVQLAAAADLPGCWDSAQAAQPALGDALRGAAAGLASGSAAAACAPSGATALPATAAAQLASLAGAHQGELYVLAACFFYALTTVRLSYHAPRHDPVRLAAAKTVALAAASFAWLLANGSAAGSSAAAAGAGVAAAAAGGAVPAWLQVPPALLHGKGLALLVYSAVGPGALATVLQAKGQAAVPAAQAQVVYSLTPVWSALLAAATLPGEGMGRGAWAGAAVIVAASIAVALAPVAPAAGARRV